MEKLNTELVSKTFYNNLQRAYGMRGNIMQRVYFANTYLLSKLWYTSQVFKLEEKTVNKMLNRVLQFIYTGENERPVRAVNFRMKEQGGLGLIHPVWKARAFLVKNMIKEYLNTENNEDSIKIEKVYGYTEDMESVINAEIGKDVKSIYNHLMKSILEKNGSLIPSRNEKKVSGIKWNLEWKNQNLVKGITGSERVFVWKCTQDMLEVGDRIHRKMQIEIADKRKMERNVQKEKI